MNGPRDVTRSARRWWALIAIAASVLVVGLDLTVLNLALPTISVSLHATAGNLQWIVDSCSLVLAALILPAGLLGDRYGRKRLLLASLVLFGASSAACAYAGSGGVLIAARAVLGIGAAAHLPAQAGAAVCSSAGAGIAVADKLGSSSLVDTIRTAFVHGMDLMLWTCGGIAVGCAILAAAFLPRRTQAQGDGEVTADSVPGSLPVG